MDFIISYSVGLGIQISCPFSRTMKVHVNGSNSPFLSRSWLHNLDIMFMYSARIG